MVRASVHSRVPVHASDEIVQIECRHKRAKGKKNAVQMVWHGMKSEGYIDR